LRIGLRCPLGYNELAIAWFSKFLFAAPIHQMRIGSFELKDRVFAAPDGWSHGPAISAGCVGGWVQPTR